MKKQLGMLMVMSVLCPAYSALAADGYYATKADERAGRLTLGKAPSSGSLTDAPTVGGDTCATALVIPNPGAAVFSDTGTTIGANNTVTSVQAGCEEYTSTAGPDVIYQFSLGPLASRGTALTITVTPTGGTGYDTAIYTLSTAGGGCPAGPAAAVTNCVNGSDSGSFNAAETITDTETDAMPAGTYFLFVDSFYSTGSAGQPNRLNGPYSLTFGTGPFPVELLGISID